MPEPGAQQARYEDIARDIKFNYDMHVELYSGSSWGTADALERQQQLELEKLLAQHRLLARERAGREYAGMTVQDMLRQQQATAGTRDS